MLVVDRRRGLRRLDSYPIDEVAIGIVSRLVLGEVRLQLREVFHLQGRSIVETLTRGQIVFMPSLQQK